MCDLKMPNGVSVPTVGGSDSFRRRENGSERVSAREQIYPNMGNWKEKQKRELLKV